MKRAVQFRRAGSPNPAAVLAVMLCVACMAASTVVAAKPPGGDTGGGTLYFTVPVVHNGGSTLQMWSMDANGSAKTPLPRYQGYLGYLGMPEPSRLPHGGHRWFLEAAEGTTLYAVRDDCDLDIDPSSPNRVVLVSDPNMGLTTTVARWLPGDTAVSFRAGLAGSGIYVLPIDFSTGTPNGDPAELTLVLPDSLTGGVAGHDWVANTTSLVCQDEQGALRLFDAASPAALLSDLGLATRDWALSPDGGTIAYIVGDRCLETRPLLGGATRRLVLPVCSPSRHSLTYSNWPRWSPSGTYLAYAERTSKAGPGGSMFSDICRITASGGGKTNLTNDTAAYVSLIAWRPNQ